MPRRYRAREYDEDMYEVERDHYHRKHQHRPRGGRQYKEEVLYEQPRAPSPPPVEEFDRLRIRDNAGPELIREPPRETSKELRKVRDDTSKRRRPHRREVVEEEEEEEYVSQDEELTRRITGSESEDEVPIIPKRRSAPRRGDRRDELSKPRSRRSEYERELPPSVDEMKHEYRKPAVALIIMHRHGYDLKEDDYEEEEDDILVRRSRRRRPPRKVDLHEDNNSTSSPESEDSADVSLAQAPIHRSPAKRHVHDLEDYDLSRPPRPPRAPSPEVSFEKPKREKLRPTSHEEILVEERGGPELPNIVRGTPPESFLRQREEEYPTPQSRPRSIEREKEISIHEVMPGGFDEHEVLEEVYGRPRELERSIRETTPKMTGDDWAIISAAPKTERGALLDEISHGPREPALKGKKPKFTVSEERHSESDPDFARGKVGRRYIGMKDQRNGLWTEITKDLVVREAIERSGYEYEETVSSYYVFSYLQFDDVSALVDLSEDIRRARRRRIQEIHRERSSMPPPAPPAPPAAMPGEPPLMLDRPMSPPFRPREERRMKQRELVDDRRGRPPSGRW
ncbi:conserved glutamic acid rich protein [Aspergillus arachidicola]|uniref:Conserved glutamic acid rich protein n=1 Tax=Aspergillus arachidicola TaxID=656916 RepID=A0A2G7G2S9_9EURO|nr:conserved glutamic acid rich protein [Aspergillus arachidicola]